MWLCQINCRLGPLCYSWSQNSNKATVVYVTLLSTNLKASIGGVETSRQFYKVHIGQPVSKDDPLANGVAILGHSYLYVWNSFLRFILAYIDTICNVTTCFSFAG